MPATSGSLSVSTSVQLNALTEKSFLLLVLLEQRRVVQLSDTGSLSAAGRAVRYLVEEQDTRKLRAAKLDITLNVQQDGKFQEAASSSVPLPAIVQATEGYTLRLHRPDADALTALVEPLLAIVLQCSADLPWLPAGYFQAPARTSSRSPRTSEDVKGGRFSSRRLVSPFSAAACGEFKYSMDEPRAAVQPPAVLADSHTAALAGTDTAASAATGRGFAQSELEDFDSGQLQPGALLGSVTLPSPSLGMSTALSFNAVCEQVTTIFWGLFNKS